MYAFLFLFIIRAQHIFSKIRKLNPRTIGSKTKNAQALELWELRETSMLVDDNIFALNLYAQFFEKTYGETWNRNIHSILVVERTACATLSETTCPDGCVNSIVRDFQTRLILLYV